MSTRLTDLQPWLYPWARYLVAWAQQYGVQVTSVYRSPSEQAQLYQDYLSGYSKYPALPPGQSRHGQRRAWDMAGDARVLEVAGRWWESVGGRWGGRDGTDPIHFEA